MRHTPVGGTNTAHLVGCAFDPMGKQISSHPCQDRSNAVFSSASMFDAYGLRFGWLDPGLDGSSHDHIGYKGQFGCYTDYESGLIYCHNRYYSPAFGRWISRDPIGLEGGLNVYEFCGNNPVS